MNILPGYILNQYVSRTPNLEEFYKPHRVGPIGRVISNLLDRLALIGKTSPHTQLFFSSVTDQIGPVCSGIERTLVLIPI